MKDVDITKLSDHELLMYKHQIESDMERFDLIQKTRKIQLNSAYGALGTKYFRYFDVNVAESVTLSGRVVYSWIADKINEKINTILKTKDVDYIVGADTDSWYIQLGTVVKKAFVNKSPATDEILNFVNKFCEQVLSPIFKEESSSLAEYTNALVNSVSVKRESIANKGIWSIKKRYALSVLDDEGHRYETPKIKLVGGDAVKSSTPKMCRDAIKESIKLMLQGTEAELQNFILDFKNKFMKSDPKTIATSLSVSSLDYKLPNGKFKSGAPFQSIGAITYNDLILAKGLEKKYSLIKEGEKIFVLALLKKNPINSSWISFTGNIPPEFGIEKFIDYDRQFKKSFLTPVEGYLNVIGWKSEKDRSVFSLFE